MKMITLPKLLDSLREWKFEVTVPEEIAERARGAIDRMVAIADPARTCARCLLRASGVGCASIP